MNAKGVGMMAGYFDFEFTQQRPASLRHVLNRRYRGAVQFEIRAPDAAGLLVIWARTADEARDHALNALFDLVFAGQRVQHGLGCPRCPVCGAHARRRGRNSAGKRKWECIAIDCRRWFVQERGGSGGVGHPTAAKRLEFHRLIAQGRTVREACAALGIARGTGYKWRRKMRAAKGAGA